MKTIKLIDLLNKIANGEAVPRVIKYDRQEWEYNPINDYEDKKYGGCLLNQITLDQLTDEVEIIEEKKKIPEKLETYKENNEIFLENFCYESLPIYKDSLSPNERVIVDKINEVLDYLESKEKGE